MNTVRMVIVVLVTYALGLGTGVVGGVALSYKELSKPVAAAAPPVTPKAVASSVTLAPAASTPPATVAVVTSPPASPLVAPSPALATQTPVQAVFNTPAASASVVVPAETASEAPAATAPEPAESESPEATDTPAAETTTPTAKNNDSAVLLIDANKGEGFITMIDGQKAGETPIKVSVVPGKHAVVVKGGDKFTSTHLTITVLAGQTKKVVVNLHSKDTPTPTPTAAAEVPVSHPVYHAPSGPSNSGGGPPSVQGNRRF